MRRRARFDSLDDVAEVVEAIPDEAVDAGRARTSRTTGCA